MQGGGRASDLLLHVALNKAEEFGCEVQKVGDDGVDRDKVEGEFRVQVWVVVGVHTCEGGGEGGREGGR